MWEGLQRIGVEMKLPWLVMGGFNSPLSPSDNHGGATITSYQTSDFQDFVIEFRMEDMN